MDEYEKLSAKLKAEKPEVGEAVHEKEAADLKKSAVKKIAFVAVLGALLVIGAYLRSSKPAEEVDPRVADISETYTCRRCGKTFNLTIAEATKQRRGHASIPCPSCSEPGAAKGDARALPDDAPAPLPPDTDRTPERRVKPHGVTRRIRKHRE
jgi:DNA-directed RNA polymerase subunit RPC12/RpoP